MEVVRSYGPKALEEIYKAALCVSLDKDEMMRIKKNLILREKRQI